MLRAYHPQTRGSLEIAAAATQAQNRESEQGRRNTRIKIAGQSQSHGDGFIYSAADIPPEDDHDHDHDGNHDSRGAAGDEGVDGVADQIDRFLSIVDWGKVQKPAGWDE
ncbi:hypothetical protein IAU59_004471 [Kwoniella sp. CBS 9459]